MASQFIDWEAVTTHPTFFNNIDLRSSGPERTLMFDPNAHALLEILPASMRDRRNLGAQLIRRISPVAAAVANANTLLPISVPFALQHFAEAMRPLLGRIRRAIFENTYRTTASWPMLALLYRSDPKWRKTMEEHLLDDERFADIFDAGEIRRRWQALCNGDRQKSQDIELLVEVGILSSMCLRR